MLLKNKTALITGAGRGIGQGIAITFAEQGANLVLVARTASELAETEKMVHDAGGEALVVSCDVTQPDQVQAMADAALDAFGQVDILINNAGYGCFKPFMELSLEEFQRTMDVNLTGVFLCTQAIAADMIARQAGCIINISSVSGLRPIMRQSAYCASKHGLNGLTSTLAMELKEHNIRVHAICPGGVVTRLVHEQMPERDKTDWMEPEDIAHAALFLATMPPRATTDVLYIRRFGSVPLGG